MKYSQKTHDLIKRIEKVNLRQKYVFDKEKITELVKECYNLFDLKIPKIIWCKDITDEKLLRAARAVREAGAAWAARAAGEAGDYDFDNFVFNYEYSQTNKINKNDKKFLQAQELFLQLKESGMGYWAEQDNKLYIVPNPIILLDENLKFHSEIKSSIEWKDGFKLWYLDGINFEYELWKKITDKTILVKEAFGLKNAEQRIIAIKYLGDKIIKDYKSISKDEYGEIIELKNLKDTTDKPYRYLKALDPSKNEYVYLRCHPDTKTPQEAQTKGYKLDIFKLLYLPIKRT